MHVLLITSEDLNEQNTMASIFELSMAKALKQAGIKVGILSVGYFTSANILKEISARILDKEYDYYRFRQIKFQELVKIFFGTIKNSLLKKTMVRKLMLQGIVVYESLFNELHFCMDEKGHWKWIKHGYEGFENYVSDYGRPDIIHAHSRFLLAALLAKLIKERDFIPYIMTEHSSFYFRNMVREFQVKMAIECITEANQLTVVSHALGQRIKDRLGINNYFKVVPNILDDIFNQVQPVVPEQNFTFLSVSNLDVNKNQQLLIRAFSNIAAQIPSGVLKIGGSGAELQNLVSLAKTTGLNDRILFLGHLTHQQVVDEMKKCNVFILPSRFETFGVVLIEALACGKPVIATRSGGPEDIINETNGILVDHDPDELGVAMVSMYNNISNYDPQKINEACLDKYSSKAIVRQWVSIYNEVIN